MTNQIVQASQKLSFSLFCNVANPKICNVECKICFKTNVTWSKI